jgi:hypothetical protein
MKLFRCCCGCFGSKEQNQSRSQNEAIVAIQIIENTDQQQPPPLPPESNKIFVDTKFKIEDVKCSEFTPANTQLGVFNYNCPICLRYFSTILVLKCCKQYICHLCIEDLGKDVKFEVACPHCKAVPITASDVDFNSTVKRYSDSPYGTQQKSNNNPNNKWVPMNVVNEDLELEESGQIKDSLSIPPQPSSTRMHMTA